jgi:mono/diheme cytochrome c family protein
MNHLSITVRWERLVAVVAVVAAALASVTGCGKTPAFFVLNEVELTHREFTPDQQQTVANVLYAMFGTPDNPYILKATSLNANKVIAASGPVWSDKQGRGRGIYRQQCGHCHGTSGDGDGPTAALLNPYPRDYRRGLFKFKSTERAAQPTDADLERVIRYGVPGTAMPAFDLLPKDEVAALVEYVKYLSIRGQTEYALAAAISDLGEDEKLALDYPTLIESILQPIAEKWEQANKQVIQPPAKPEVKLAESVDKGRELYYGTKANCVKCHGPSELGDGQTTDYDDWTKPLVEYAKEVHEGLRTIPSDPDLSSAQKSERLAELEQLATAIEDTTLPPRNILPRNLRSGIYRGGGRPLDLFRRISAGINGVPMPGVGPATGTTGGVLSPDEIWHLVDYIQSLPYEPINQPPKPTSITGQGQM